MPIDAIENSIDQAISAQARGLVVKALLDQAGDTTLPDLVKLCDSAKYGDVAKKISLQEVIDAYVETQKLVPEPEEGKVEAPAAPSKPASKKGKKASKKRAAKKRPSKSSGKGGGGGTAAPGREVNFRDPEEKQRYYNQIESMVQERGGEPISSSEIVDACGGSSNQAREILRQLEKEAKVVYTGKARATRYYWKVNATPEIIAQYEKEQASLTGAA